MKSALPRRDLFLLPLISIATLLLMFAVGEGVSRRLFSESYQAGCYVSDPVLGYRNKPNCRSTRKSPEGPLLSYRSNDCGYRSTESCGPKPPGTVRVAVLGDSFTLGDMVPYNSILTAKAGRILSASCGRAVEFQNMGTSGYRIFSTYLRVPETLALNPDLVILTLDPADMFDIIDNAQLKSHRTSAPPPDAGAAAATKGWLQTLRSTLSDSRMVLVAQHYIFEANTDFYVQLYLSRGDKSDYLREPLTPAWKKRYEQLDLFLGGMAQQYHAHGIPLLLVTVPARVQAALVKRKKMPSGVDPLLFSRMVGAIAKKRDISVLDTVSRIGRFERPEGLYYAVDGHMGARGHEWIGELIARRLAQSMPALKNCKVAP